MDHNYLIYFLFTFLIVKIRKRMYSITILLASIPLENSSALRLKSRLTSPLDFYHWRLWSSVSSSGIFSFMFEVIFSLCSSFYRVPSCLLLLLSSVLLCFVSSSFSSSTSYSLPYFPSLYSLLLNFFHRRHNDDCDICTFVLV